MWVIFEKNHFSGCINTIFPSNIENKQFFYYVKTLITVKYLTKCFDGHKNVSLINQRNII